MDELRFGHLPEATGQQLACKESIPAEVQHNVTVLTAHITGMPAVKDNTAVEVIRGRLLHYKMYVYYCSIDLGHFLRE